MVKGRKSRGERGEGERGEGRGERGHKRNELKSYNILQKAIPTSLLVLDSHHVKTATRLFKNILVILECC